MKFRARMVETMAMKKFYNILQSMTKLTKLCVLRLSADKVIFCSIRIRTPINLFLLNSTFVHFYLFDPELGLKMPSQ
jgi:hypothetical protein